MPGCRAQATTDPGLGEKPRARDCRAEATCTTSGLGETCFFFLQCRARHYSSDGHEVGKKTTPSRHRGEPPKTKQTQTNKQTKTTQNKNTNKPTKGHPKKAGPRVKRCETCGNATLKLSNVLLQEVVPNIVWCSVPNWKVSNYLLCICHTSRSIFEKVASSCSGLLSSI